MANFKFSCRAWSFFKRALLKDFSFLPSQMWNMWFHKSLLAPAPVRFLAWGGVREADRAWCVVLWKTDGMYFITLCMLQRHGYWIVGPRWYLEGWIPGTLLKESWHNGCLLKIKCNSLRWNVLRLLARVADFFFYWNWIFVQAEIN